MSNILKHLAIIMDGNRRWAKGSNLSITKGHKKGADTLKSIISYLLKDTDIKYLSCYAFSSENWKRSKIEIDYLIVLLSKYLKEEQSFFLENNIKVKVIGNYGRFGKNIDQNIKELQEKTNNNTGLHLIIALNYGSRNEIIDAVNNIIKNQRENITEEEFNNYLYTKDIPDPDLLIRTGKEKRLSNFLLWQIYYTELYFSDTLWPDFTNKELEDIILDYRKRKIRKGR